MGRHRQKSSSKLRRNSMVALVGIAPVAVITAVASGGAHAQIPFLTAETQLHNTALDSSITATTATAPSPAAPPVVEAPVALPVAPPPPPAPPVTLIPQLPTDMAASPIAVPAMNVAAYQNAERLLAVSQPGCGISWTLIAGIGRVESRHANNGALDANGTLLKPIYGPMLDGSLAGNNVVMDTDGGALDGSSSYDRAVGPMQFLPQTWNKYHADGNGDGVSNPQNIFDAALTTGDYLCDGGLNLRDLGQTTKAILRYNNSLAYVANVLAWSVGYATGIVPAADALPHIL